MYARFAARAGLAEDAPYARVIEAVHAIPFGRPAERTPDGVIEEWVGTCSTKHVLLAALLRERRPELRPRLVHRVYRADRESVLRRYGAVAAAAVPEDGLTDVHRYLVIDVGGRDVRIDVTFPGDPGWDGRHSMALACGDGVDFAAGEDPAADKAALEARHCDPRVREPFIAALTDASARRDGGHLGVN
jgi:hypothetical protein